ncbi:hypothetical protein Glove_217g114 [Diversispora epigaea]|uniref:Serine-threonine/tyrosine-protein kinase catalytic domain-containing protein n=1 Tax=Diversispora epigaea TaxID=1348612 RepID=A0A397ILV6_9GLOM|nr:hypothetical protein Glove_217g114 [Diversispora epigaea]
MRCWDARVIHRPTFKELSNEFLKYYRDYYYYLNEGKNKDSEIGIQIIKAEEFSENQESTNTTTTTTPTLQLLLIVFFFKPTEPHSKMFIILDNKYNL